MKVIRDLLICILFTNGFSDFEVSSEVDLSSFTPFISALNPELNIAGGMRYDQYKLKYTYGYEAIVTNSLESCEFCKWNFEQTYHQFTVGYIYQINDDHSLGFSANWIMSYLKFNHEKVDNNEFSNYGMGFSYIRKFSLGDKANFYVEPQIAYFVKTVSESFKPMDRETKSSFPFLKGNSVDISIFVGLEFLVF
jgi:hypothetical protein